MSDCGCKKKGMPYDTQAWELVQPPRNKVEQVTPERPDTGRMLLEYTPQPTLRPLVPSLPPVFRFDTQMTSLSLGGFVPYNVVAFLVPSENVGPLLDDATLNRLSNSVNMNAPLAGFLPSGGIDQYWIMRPGEILEFGRVINGVAGFFAAPWSGLFPRHSMLAPGSAGLVSIGQDATKSVNCILNSYQQANLQAGANIGFANSSPPQPAYGTNFDPNFPQTGPLFAPVLRASYGRLQPVSVPYTRMPWTVPNVAFLTPNGNVCIPPGTRFVTLNFGGGSMLPSPQPQRDVANPYGYEPYLRAGYPKKMAGAYGGPFDVTVEWVGYDGIGHRHPADQLDASARGAVSAEHDIEVFEVPQNAAAMNLYYKGNLTIPDSNGISVVSYCFTGAGH